MAPSLPLLRSWRSTIYAPSRHESANAVVVNKAVESQASINNRFSEQQQQQHYESSVTELRRRLARKASTFSLRGKNRRSQRYLRELVKAEEASKMKKEEEKSETSSVKTVTQEGQQRGNRDNNQGHKEATASVGTISSFAAAAAATHKTRQNVPHPQQQREHTSVSMASSTSEPPVPFERLQTIATEVCFFGFSCLPLSVRVVSMEVGDIFLLTQYNCSPGL